MDILNVDVNKKTNSGASGFDGAIISRTDTKRMDYTCFTRTWYAHSRYGNNYVTKMEITILSFRLHIYFAIYSHFYSLYV